MTLSPALKINFKFKDMCLMTGKEMGMCLNCGWYVD